MPATSAGMTERVPRLVWKTRYLALALNAIGDMCRATRLAIMGAVVAAYFLKCAVARWASRAAALS